MRMATALSDGRPALWASGTRGYHLVTGCGDTVDANFSDVTDVGTALELGQLRKIGEHIVDLDNQTAGVEIEDLELLPPVTRPRALVCVGRNYAEHVAEGGVPLPDEPLLFSKFVNALAPAGTKVPYPSITSQLDYEGELALVIGREAHAVKRSEAFDYIAGYTIMNDISARDLQESDMQWIRGKSLDAFAPIGPCVVTVDEVSDVDSLQIRTWVNGELRQDASVGDMHFKIPQLLEFITEAITLQAGDIVATGTPSGVGLGFQPPKWLYPGDQVAVSIDPIGTLRCSIV
ncbi:MAG: fumarylacetoacetate hydrolase family protein [Gemmatimonadaceae bacterium]